MNMHDLERQVNSLQSEIHRNENKIRELESNLRTLINKIEEVNSKYSNTNYGLTLLVNILADVPELEPYHNTLVEIKRFI